MAAAADPDKLLKQAEKLAMVSLTQWKPNYEAAAPLYEQAANAYKNSNRKAQAMQAFEKLATCKEKLQEPWSAAKHLESAGQCARESGSATTDEVAAFFKRAALLYGEANRPQAAAEALSRGGRALEAVDASLACELYLEACGIFEEEGKDAFAMDTYRAAAAAMVRGDKLADCITVLLRHAGACDRTGSAASLARCYLSAVIVYLAMGDPVGAEAGYYDFMEVPAFERSEEARAAWELLDAYQQTDEGAVKKCAGRGVMTGLEQVFIKMVKKLPTGDFAAQAAALNAARGGGPSAAAAELDDLDGDLT